MSLNVSRRDIPIGPRPRRARAVVRALVIGAAALVVGALTIAVVVVATA
jgi:hypothetical protein